tara:strand:+ start:479 stop:940 length:462 start_codon:yes stop_codon:yes gene_type:complete
MKLNIIRENGQKVSGFRNIASHHTEDSTIDVCDFKNLNPIVDDAEAQYILARDIINYINHEELFSTISHWISKLSHGGVICIGSSDIKEICRMIYTGEIPDSDIGSILYGVEGETKKSSVQVNSLVDFLQSSGLKILKIRLENYNLTVEAQRQ